MTARRSLHLTYLYNKQFWQKLRYDLGRELVVLISSAVLLGLFVYIFRDFVGEKIQVIPEPQQKAIARGFALVILLLLGPVLASPLLTLWKDEPSLRSLAARSGEHPQGLFVFAFLQSSLILGTGFGLYWLTVGRAWGQWSLAAACGWQLLSFGLLAGRMILQRPREEKGMKALLDDQKASRPATLLAWRWRQLLFRNRLAKLSLSLALLLLVLQALALGMQGPYALAVLQSMVIGLLIACAPSFQLEEDMRAIWFERQIACSHDEYVDVYQRLCYRLAFGSLVSVFLLTALATGFQNPLAALKLAAITALFPILLPAVMFQLAPERPILQIMIIALIGLFLGTAVFAHWGAIVLLPILLTYAKQYQKNNFYRS